jgi:hypothetical protein
MARVDLRAGGRAALLAALLTLVGTLTASQPAPRGGPPAAGHGPAAATDLLVDSFRSSRTYAAVAVPVRLRIPAAGVDTPLQPLGRNPDGTIAVPTDPAVAGWYAEGPRAGPPGPRGTQGARAARTPPPQG